jgi:quinol monooxygenase YgiN
MWAQLIKMRVKPGKDTVELNKQLQAVEQPGSGLLRTILMRDQKDPDQLYSLVVFESEEKARAREQDPRRQEGLHTVRAIMGEILASPPEFIDLAVIDEWTT